jgi:hypothetical protein
MAVDLAEMEKRLTAVEMVLTQLQQRLGFVPRPGNWVEQISGSLADIPEEDYQKFLECCRAVRGGGPVSAAEDSGT